MWKVAREYPFVFWIYFHFYKVITSIVNIAPTAHSLPS